MFLCLVIQPDSVYISTIPCLIYWTQYSHQYGLYLVRHPTAGFKLRTSPIDQNVTNDALDRSAMNADSHLSELNPTQHHFLILNIHSCKKILVIIAKTYVLSVVVF